MEKAPRLTKNIGYIGAGTVEWQRRNRQVLLLEQPAFAD